MWNQQLCSLPIGKLLCCLMEWESIYDPASHQHDHGWVHGPCSRVFFVDEPCSRVKSELCRCAICAHRHTQRSIYYHRQSSSASSHGVIKEVESASFKFPIRTNALRNGVITLQSLLFTFLQNRANFVHLYETGPQPFFLFFFGFLSLFCLDKNENLFMKRIYLYPN